jgi:two-component system response regulator FlrC
LPDFTEAAEQQLLRHPWPGNVRELDNLMQRALILSSSDTIDVADLCFESTSTDAKAEGAAQPASVGKLPEDLRSVEEQMILDALGEGGVSRKHVASRLGISERTLRYKIARMRDAGVAIPG